MDVINSVMDVAKDVVPTVKKYVKYQICHNDYVIEFKEMQRKLERQRKDVAEELLTQLMQPGKIAKQEVEAWLKEAEQETAENVVENLIFKWGCFTYICSSGKLDKRTPSLNEGIFNQGEKYTNAGESLVVDDHSIKGVPLLVNKCSGRDDIQDQIMEWLKGDEVTRIEYCATVFKEKQEQLKLRQKDIVEKLETWLLQPGKMATKEVEDWLKKVGQQIPIKVEDLINQGECSSPSNLRKKTEELKKIFEQGEKYINAGESLVINGYSIEYCTTVFTEKQEQLKLRQNIEAKLETELMQPGKIAKKEVEDWFKKANQQIAIKVEDLISEGECSSSTTLKKNTEELKQILEEGKEFTNSGVSLAIDDHSIKGVPLLVDKCSGRDDIQDQIMEWLKGDEVTKIVVSGMGGVGKTTIMKQVHNQLLKEPKFNEVIWVKVSKDFEIIIQHKKKFNILKFQKRIASSLELKLEPEDHENETKLAGLISQRLGQGSFLLILDDVWEPFSLEDVGIPDLVGNNGRKLVLTTRLQHIARVMDCKMIMVNPLPVNEASALFLEKVGEVMCF